ncbi:solute carrier family 26 (sodium-independent sulfate anion transporter), member 11 [Cryptococcus neoformans Gb118]|nr:solute carrier family 26 (sodium-independent sulfate anion transporter), member 11 [Cryptococcus neoformans var. grubii MW-RSA36]OXL11680.1 solute carrier family 26 (sodium-independent sulfate anion transporter), member 11 [Cryptococcus neoformans var. grubii Gb118]
MGLIKNSLGNSRTGKFVDCSTPSLHVSSFIRIQEDSSSTAAARTSTQEDLPAPMSPDVKPGFRPEMVKSKVKHYFGYTETTPETISVFDWARSQTPALGPGIKAYILSLFPFIQWVPRYNLTWLFGDLVAGITVGMVLVPQSLSYAKIAELEPQYGLYSSFIGVLTYAFFATSKDVSIGPVAVMSLETGNIILSVQDKYGDLYPKPVIATALAFICGFIVLGIGLLRIGWLVEFIPQPAVSGFMTGSALNIAAGQFPAVFGLSKKFDTRAATYEVIINTLKHLPEASLDTAFGMTALATLYGIKWGFTWLGKRYPRYGRITFFCQSLRHAFVIIIWTIISWRVNVHAASPRISLVGHVPSGLQHVGRPYIDSQLLSAIGPHIPVATIILLLEHISIAKSFGRLNGYKINPNQELIAIGVNNTIGTLFSAYPSTGSFSRSALKSKAGVRTPAAGLATGVVVIVALYAVAPAFYWIPNAALSALIIHAVADLVASPKHSYGFWRVAPIEYLIFVGAVLWSVFYTIESGIYWSLATSVVLLLLRIARPKGHFLGRVRIKPEAGNTLEHIRDVYVPLDEESSREDVKVENPPAGVIIYRFEESFLYPNASYINDRLIEQAKKVTRRGGDYSKIAAGDRPWNDPGPSKKKAAAAIEADMVKPVLKAVILDFAAVANLDTTGVQNLIDTKTEMEKWADGPVEFHFCGILSPWIRRALIAGGFGQGRAKEGAALEVAPAVIENLENAASPGIERERYNQHEASFIHEIGQPSTSTSAGTSFSEEEKRIGSGFATPSSTKTVPLLDRSTPFFHFDLADALNSLNLPENE